MKIKVGGGDSIHPLSEATSGYISNSNNPNWKEESLFLDFRLSGEEGTIEVWDHDSGLEFEDDKLVSEVKFNVPYCSMNSKYARLNKACQDLAPGVPCETHESR